MNGLLKMFQLKSTKEKEKKKNIVISTNDMFLRFTELNQKHMVKILSVNDSGHIVALDNNGNIKFIKHNRLIYLIKNNFDLYKDKTVEIELIDITNNEDYNYYDFKTTIIK